MWIARHALSSIILRISRASRYHVIIVAHGRSPFQYLFYSISNTPDSNATSDDFTLDWHKNVYTYSYYARRDSISCEWIRRDVHCFANKMSERDHGVSVARFGHINGSKLSAGGGKKSSEIREFKLHADYGRIVARLTPIRRKGRALHCLVSPLVERRSATPLRVACYT